MKPAAKAARDKATIIAWRDQFLTKRDAADAQLIEAAPDLLEALRGLFGAVESDLSTFNLPCTARLLEAQDAARAAIAKATGEAV